MESFQPGQTVKPDVEYLAYLELPERMKIELARGGKFVMFDTRVSENDIWKMTAIGHFKIYVIVVVEFKRVIQKVEMRCTDFTVNISGVLDDNRPLDGRRRIRA